MFQVTLSGQALAASQPPTEGLRRLSRTTEPSISMVGVKRSPRSIELWGKGRAVAADNRAFRELSHQSPANTPYAPGGLMNRTGRQIPSLGLVASQSLPQA